uniref:RECA_2 domain-containing protein n=1 Tax=Strongyloides papillosus TaxID=174720 RepID=A0A0N5BIX0_STREA
MSESLLDALRRLGSKQHTHSFGLPEFDQLFDNGIVCGEISELASEDGCYVTDFCIQLIAHFLQDQTKSKDKLLYIDSRNTFKIDRLMELIDDNGCAKNLDNIDRVKVKQIHTIEELYNTLHNLPDLLKHDRVSLLIINSICGCILSQELIFAADYSSSVETILHKLQKLARQEKLAILTVNGIVKPDSYHELIPLLGYKWLKQIPRRVSLHRDNYVSNMVKKNIYYAKKYELGKLIRPEDLVRYRRTEKGIEIYKL